MGGEWREIRIEEIAERVAMGPFGSSIKVETFVPEGVPVISGQHLHGFKVDDTVGFNFITPEHAERLKNANVQRGDIIFTHAGNIGQVAYIPDDSKYERYVISQRQFYMRCDRSKAIPEFVVAFFKTPEGQHRLLANTSQVGVPSIAQPVTYLRTIEIPLPPLPDQRAIAHILGTLDDKIEVNRRMSETLEEMARAIFKSWFVNFDPVCAKAAVRREHPDWTNAQVSRAAIVRARCNVPLRPEIAELFPDRLVDSELGEIPEGWEVGTLGDVAEHPRRGVQPNRVAPDTAYIALEHMPRRCIALSDWGTAEGIESNKFEFSKGEILFGKLRPYFHKVGVAPVDGVCSTDIVVVCPRTPHWFAFVLGVVSSDDFVEYTNAGSTGTKMPRTSWTEMARYNIVLSPEALAQAFNDKVQPQVERIITAINETRTLAALRDTLLPKLISGEIRVNDAEKFLEKRGL
jgi:type I restriction enzyme S subunit